MKASIQVQYHLTVARAEAAEAARQFLLDQSSRWEAQALEAGERIAGLEALVRKLRDALTCADRDLAETAVTTGYRMRNDTAQKMTHAFARADKLLAGESGDSGKQRREDFVAGAAYGGYMDFGKSTAKEAGEQARAEALRRYPEKPQEGKDA